jgi:hypothetical protein
MKNEPKKKEILQVADVKSGFSFQCKKIRVKAVSLSLSLSLSPPPSLPEYCFHKLI